MNTLARLFQPLNKQRSRKDLTGDEWRQDRGGMKPVCLSQPAESTKSKSEHLMILSLQVQSYLVIIPLDVTFEMEE